VTGTGPICLQSPAAIPVYVFKFEDEDILGVMRKAKNINSIDYTTIPFGTESVAYQWSTW
jgi:hypothetical protein